MGKTIPIVVILIAVFFCVHLLNRSRLKRRLNTLKLRLSAEQRRELGETFLLYAKLPEDIKDRLDGWIHLFLEEKGFEACGGLDEVTPFMRRVIAAQACLLIVNRPDDFYRDLRTILVYPNAFGFDENGVRLGESWSTGSVILSWASVESGGKNDEDGHDVSLHEFSHQLDQVNTAGPGLPFLDNRAAYGTWSHVFRSAFEVFCKKVEKGKPTVMDKYGATNPAEFFAVATETFFEKPKQLEEKYPELYEVLRDYYKLDPLKW